LIEVNNQKTFSKLWGGVVVVFEWDEVWSSGVKQHLAASQSNGNSFSYNYP